MSFGTKNSMILLKSGMVAVCGDNSKGQISFYSADSSDEFKIIPNLYRIQRIECSTFLTALNLNRDLFIFGKVPFLDNCIQQVDQFWVLNGFSLIIDYAIGADFIIINDIRAGIFSCGKNNKGQLAREKDFEAKFNVVNQLVQVKIKSIKCGHDFVLCEMGVMPIHPRDEILIQNLYQDENENVTGNENFPEEVTMLNELGDDNHQNGNNESHNRNLSNQMYDSNPNNYYKNQSKDINC